MTSQPLNSESDKTHYLQEALRLSELAIAEDSSTFDRIERKAVLLVTLHIATIVYLLSWTDDSDSKLTTIISFIIIIVLIIAVGFGVSALYPRAFGTPGATPKYLRWKGFDHNCDKMVEDLLDSYDSILILNDNVLGEKSRHLILSFWWGVVGIASTCIFAFCYKLGIMP